ncbi:MAG: carboxylesterase family protein [Clostridiales bacterium]|nr:carboxylesterase family protein [Clostridiales bacterium]
MSIGIVNTTYGKVQGIDLDGKYEGVTFFKGIPYAAPPIGDLRWAPPQDMEPWEGVRQCVEYAPIEIQYQAMHLDIVYENMSEDCLYLNLTTAASSPGEKRPVYIWLHGGGQTNGHNHLDGEDIREFARRGCVVVSVGHRLNIFGYMALPQISAEQGGYSGNYGLMDLIKALDWVTDNIEQFGGDPDNITVGGQSGGSTKACVLASIPASKGRIKRVITESGLKWAQPDFLTIQEAEAFGLDYLRYIGVDTSLTARELRALDSLEIHRDVPRDNYPGDFIYDGDLIPYPSIKACFEAGLDRIDFLTFTTLGESNVFAAAGDPGTYGFFRGDTLPITDTESFYAFFKERLGNLYDKYNFRELVQVDDETALNEAKKLGSFGLARCASNNYSRNLMLNRIFAEYMKKKNPKNKNYVCLWAKSTPLPRVNTATDYNEKNPLPDHGNERWYVFGAIEENYPEGAKWQEVDYQVSEISSTYWCNFIKYGDPNGEGLTSWPDAGEDYGYVVIGDDVTVHSGLTSPLDQLTYEYVLREYGIEQLVHPDKECEK